jgi:predicted membrane-bound spermidine synthase
VNLRRLTVSLAVSLAGCALVAATSVLGLLAAAMPAGAMAPQPVDASEQGGIAFVLFAVMCGLFAASLFYMDRVRRRRSGEEK